MNSFLKPLQNIPAGNTLTNTHTNKNILTIGGEEDDICASGSIIVDLQAKVQEEIEEDRRKTTKEDNKVKKEDNPLCLKTNKKL